MTETLPHREAAERRAGRVVVSSPPNAMMRGMEDFDGVFALRAETTWDDQHVQ